jgi:2-polyprenyl-6-methoxyphenol hydroxylase-like FAD-dependent oxidoreductase
MVQTLFGAAAVLLEGGEALQGALVVGAEGVRSPIAAQLGVGAQNYAGYSAYRWLWHGALDGTVLRPVLDSTSSASGLERFSAFCLLSG